MHSKIILIEQAKEKVELQKRREKREQMLYEERIIGIDTSNMDEFQVEYYKSLKVKIIQNRQNSRFPDL